LPAITIWQSVRVQRDVAYLPEHARDGVLDLYLQPGQSQRPTLIYFHGGGLRKSSHKEEVRIWHLPFLYMGWNVVNVEYERSESASAPAAVQDSVCAVRWVEAHAAEYHIDPRRIALMGDSAGGFLALTVGLSPAGSGPGAANPANECPQGEPSRVAAIISWAGVTDLPSLLTGPDQRPYARDWIGDRPDGPALAARLSPVNRIGPTAPPILLIHSDADPVIPYTQATRLRDALVKAGAPSRLLTLSSTRHTQTGMAITAYVYVRIAQFLHDFGIGLFP
jgi:acetyl esterase/lipase